jgi:NRPS condensation-like uncharacterized protein
MVPFDDLPRRLPTVVADRVMAGFVRVADTTIRTRLHFGHRLDEQRLRDALLLARLAEPVLGCRYVDRAAWPYWERVPAVDPLSLAPSEAAWHAWGAGPLDGLRGGQLEGGLWRGPDGDCLLIKLGHLAGDAGATRQVLGLVADLYARLAREPRYVPVPNLRGDRGVGQVLRAVPPAAWRDSGRLWGRRVLADLAPAGIHRMPLQGGVAGRHDPGELDLDPARVTRLKAFGRPLGATLNDLLLAAFLRTQARLGSWDGRRQLRVTTTVDLRRYLPGRRAGAVCNLTSYDHPSLGTDLGAAYTDTVRRVTAVTSVHKRSYLGLSGALGLAFIVKPMPYVVVRRFDPSGGPALHRHPRLADGLTNAGEIPPSAVTFDAPARTARMLVPPSSPPFFLVGVSGYAGTVSLSLAPREGALAGVTAAGWLAALASELPD